MVTARSTDARFARQRWKTLTDYDLTQLTPGKHVLAVERSMNELEWIDSRHAPSCGSAWSLKSFGRNLKVASLTDSRWEKRKEVGASWHRRRLSAPSQSTVVAVAVRQHITAALPPVRITSGRAAGSRFCR
jgi:hypothetical protein